MNMIEIVLLILALAVILYFVVEYSIFIPGRLGLPVLMYHKISETEANGLTLTTAQFDLQLMYLKEHGYQSITFALMKERMASGDKLPAKTVIITFDDAYQSFRDLALPLLAKYSFSATLFVPVAFIGKTNLWDRGNDRILSAEELRKIALEGNTEIGLHSFLHQNYSKMAPADMEDDLASCYAVLAHDAIPFVRVLAYPYGGYPGKDARMKWEMIEVFKKMNLDFAVRIGNRINRWPLRFPFEIKRIDIRGTDSFFVFRTKLKKGRAKLFS